MFKPKHKINTDKSIESSCLKSSHKSKRLTTSLHLGWRGRGQYTGGPDTGTFRKMRLKSSFCVYKPYELNTIKSQETSRTDLLLSRDQVPVVHKPGFQLLWDLNLHLHSVYKCLLLQKHEHIQATLPDIQPHSSVRLAQLWDIIWWIKSEPHKVNNDRVGLFLSPFQIQASKLNVRQTWRWTCSWTTDCVRTLSTVGSTRALFFLGGWAWSPPELVPSPAPGAGGIQTRKLLLLNPYGSQYWYIQLCHLQSC